MALDTAAKRLSVINLGCPWRGILPVPDGTIDQGDRQTVIYLGSSVLVGEAVIEEPAPQPSGGGGGGATSSRKRRASSRSTKSRRRSPQPADRPRYFTVRVDDDDERTEAEQRKRAAYAPPPLPRLVHEVVTFGSAGLVDTGSTGTVAFSERHRIAIRGAVVARAGSDSVKVESHFVFEPFGSAGLVETGSHDLQFEYRNQWQTVRHDNDALTAKLASMEAELARARRNTEALELLLLAA